MKKICRYLADTLHLDESTYEVMYYGLFVFVTNLINIVSVIIIGGLLGELKNTIVFLIFYTPLRLYVGGYHASTPFKCYLYFNILSTIFIIIFKYISYLEILFYLVIIMLIIIIIQMIKLKEDKQKIIIVLIYLLLCFILKTFDFYDIYLWSILLNIILFEIKYFIKK